MELKEYLKILQKNLSLIIITTILIALFAYIFTLRQPIVYEANGSLTIIPKPSAELKNVYEYGGYYSLQAASLFGQTIAFWLQSPETVSSIYEKAGFQIEKTQTSKSLAKLIKTTLIPTSFSVKFQLKEKDKNKAKKLAEATTAVIQEKVAEFNQKAGSKDKFEIAASQPIIIEVQPKKGFNAGIGGVAGLVLGIFLAFLRDYFRKS